MGGFLEGSILSFQGFVIVCFYAYNIIVQLSLVSTTSQVVTSSNTKMTIIFIGFLSNSQGVFFTALLLHHCLKRLMVQYLFSNITLSKTYWILIQRVTRININDQEIQLLYLRSRENQTLKENQTASSSNEQSNSRLKEQYRKRETSIGFNYYELWWKYLVARNMQLYLLSVLKLVYTSLIPLCPDLYFLTTAQLLLPLMLNAPIEACWINLSAEDPEAIPNHSFNPHRNQSPLSRSLSSSIGK